MGAVCQPETLGLWSSLPLALLMLLQGRWPYSGSPGLEDNGVLLDFAPVSVVQSCQSHT